MAGFGHTGSLGSWQPPALNTDLLKYYNDQASSGLALLGSMAGGAIGGGLSGMKNGSILAKGGEVADGEPTSFLAGAKEGLFSAAGGEEYKAMQNMGKSADYFVKAASASDPNFWQKMGMHPEQFKTLGSNSKGAAVSGYMQKMSMESAAAKLAQEQAQTVAMQRADSQQKALSRFSGDIATGDQVGAVEDSQRAEMLQPQQPTLYPDSSTPRWAIPAGMLQPSRMEMSAAARAPLNDRAMWALARNPEAAAAPQFDNTLSSLVRADDAPLVAHNRALAIAAEQRNLDLQQKRIELQESPTVDMQEVRVNGKVVGTKAPGSSQIYPLGYFDQTEGDLHPAMEIQVDEKGNPILDPKTGLPLKKRIEGVWQDSKGRTVKKTEDRLQSLLNALGAGTTAAPTVSNSPPRAGAVSPRVIRYGRDSNGNPVQK